MKLRLKKIKGKTKENKLTIIGILFIIIGISTFFINILYNSIRKEYEGRRIDKFINHQIDNSDVNYDENSAGIEESKSENNYEEYIAVIEIPKINLKKGIYAKDSKLNNVDKNIEILKESDLPDTPNGNVIVAGHSGTGKTAHFNQLIKLKEGDVVNIYYSNNMYSYKVTNIHEINKTGKMELENNNSSSILMLITCNKDDKTKQIVFICKQQ